MKFMVEQFLQATGAKVMQEGMQSQCLGLSTDTRTLKKGELFFALRGPNFDGRNFVKAALEKGAWGIVVEREIRNSSFDSRSGRPELAERAKFEIRNAWICQVPSTLKALGDIAQWWRGQFDIPCVAITGSNGKTTTKEMAVAILSKRLCALKTEGNFNNLIGLPLTLNRLNEKHQVAVLEMGMNAKGEIRRLTEMANPTVGLVTNTAAAHLEKLQTVEAVAQAKGELYEAMDSKGCAIYNAEDVWMRKEVQKFKGKKISFGMQPSCDVRFEHMENIGFDSIELKLAVQEKILAARLKTTGIHNVMNAMAACAVAFSLGLDLPSMKAGLEAFVPLKMRFEQVQLGGGVRLINDAYNANPVSMEVAFKTVARQPRAGRWLAVLGDMKELGKASASLHEAVGKKVVECGVDGLFLIGEFASALANGAKKAGLDLVKIMIFEKIDALIEVLEQKMKSGDIVLVKASRAMQLERVAEALKEKFGI